jgi:hypothetical protein
VQVVRVKRPEGWHAQVRHQHEHTEDA